MDITPDPALQQPSGPIEPNAAMSTPPAPEAPHNSFFFGRFGLRAGWGIAIFIAVWFLVGILGQLFGLAATGQLKPIIAARAQAHAHPHAAPQPVHFQFVWALVTVADGISFLGLLGLCWFFSRGERRRLDVYGIGRHRWKDIFPGAFWGLIAMSALVMVLHAQRVLVFDSRALSTNDAIFFGLKWLLAFFCVGLAEEYMFRGYVQYALMRGVWGLAERISPANPRPFAFWIAATTLSALFLLAHTGNGGETKFGLIAVFLAGMMFAYALWRTGSLWWGIGFHMAWDWAQSFLFGVADSGNVSVGRLFVTHPAGNPLLSGGADGPEGSIYVLGALVLALLVLRFTRPGVQPSLEQGSLGAHAPHEVAAIS